MKPFKFFQKGTLDDPQMLNDLTQATASFNEDTPGGHMYRRRLYHTDRATYDRLYRGTHMEADRYYFDRELGRFETIQPTQLTRQRIEDQEHQERLRLIRRINGGERIVPFFTGTPIATTTNPKWWMKIKIFFQEQFWFKDPAGVIAIAGGLTIFVILTIAKILSVW